MNKWLNWTPPIKEKDSLIIKEDRSDESPLYLGTSISPCTNTHRLELFWSILGECIEDRKQFIFQCENEEEANELRIFTWTLVFRINDRWEVSLDDLVVKAKPPRSNAVPNTN